MNDRHLLVVLKNAPSDSDLIRYAARLVRRNAVAGRRACAVEPAASPQNPSRSPFADADLVPVSRNESKGIVLSISRTVWFVHVLPEPAPRVNAQDRRHVAEQYLAWVQAQFAEEAPGVPVRCEVLEGRAVDRLREAAAQDCEAILLGEADRALAARLVREAACSVWLVPHRPATIRRILVPIDFSTRSADSLRVATALARLNRWAECLALHVYFHDCLIPIPEEDARIRETLEDTCTRFLANIDCLGVRVTPLLCEGASVAGVIGRTAEEEDADLIVMASRGRGTAGALLRESVAEQTMRASTRPLLVVKHFGAQLGVLEMLSEQAFWECNDQRFN